MNLLSAFLSLEDNKYLAVGGIDGIETMKGYVELLKQGFQAKYIVLKELDSDLSINFERYGCEFITWNEIYDHPIDLIIVFEEKYTDLPYYSLLGFRHQIDLISYSAFNHFDNRINNAYLALNTILMDLGVKFFDIFTPHISMLENLTSREQILASNGNYFLNKNEYYDVRAIFDDIPYADDEYIRNLVHASIEWESTFKFTENYDDQFCNVIEGTRFVPDVPEHYDNTVYILGGCFARGILAEDKHTVASFLQQKLNTLDQKVFRVVHIWSDMSTELMLSLDLMPGDYILTFGSGNVCFSHRFMDFVAKFLNGYKNMNYLYAKDIFNDKIRTNGEVYFDDHHFGHKGYQVVSDEFFKFIVNEEQGRPVSKPSQNHQRTNKLPLLMNETNI